MTVTDTKVSDDHVEIWLEPSCNQCDRERTWCQDNVYEKCEECGREPTRYLAFDRVTALCTQVREAIH